MQQMNVPEEKKIELDFDDKSLPEAIRTLQPLLFREENSYCCILGPSMKEAVVGRGNTVLAALDEWESNMRKRIIYHRKDDEIAQFIMDKLNASTNNTG
jgi:hypothetical protein